MTEFKHLPHDVCRVTSEFGYRTHPITGAKYNFHQGLDIGAKNAGIAGDKLYAVADGKVVYSASMMSTVYGYGHFIIIDHGNFSTLYGHMLGLIRGVNEFVKAGQVVGYMGSTGASTAAHLHFEVQIMKWTNYANYISKNSLGVRKYASDPYSYIQKYRTELKESEDMSNAVVRYKNVAEMPMHYQSFVRDLVNRQIIRGNEKGELNMTEDMIRTLIMSDRLDKKRI